MALNLLFQWLVLGLIWVTQGTDKPQVSIAGSSTVFPVANAWASAMQSEYEFVVSGGGSSTGARRVCAPLEDPSHVDIGCMSRNWKWGTEAVLLDDGYTLECQKESATGQKLRVTQIKVGTDGLAVVVAKGGAGHKCLTSPAMGGLTLAQLRWIFSAWTDDMLANDPDGGLDMASVIPNSNQNGMKEWRDFDESCDDVPIHPYGAGDASGTFDFFGSIVLCSDCLDGDDGHTPEGFPDCDHDAVHALEQLSRTEAQDLIRNNRNSLGAENCYAPSEDDTHILDWVLADNGGIAYFGYAYFSVNAALLTAVPVAADKVLGVQDTPLARIPPTSFSITDGSYLVFTRDLYMNVVNTAIDRVRNYLRYGFTDQGLDDVSSLGYVTVNAAQRATMMSVIMQGPNLQADYVPAKPDSCPSGSGLNATSYLNQWGVPKIRYTCDPCPVGTAKRFDAAIPCASCAEGRAAPSPGQLDCDICDKGYHAPDATECQPCPPGFVKGERSSASCTACPPGSYASTSGMSACAPCPVGTFSQDAHQTECESCSGSHRTTLHLLEVEADVYRWVELLAATNASACGCERDHRPINGRLEDEDCVVCTEGIKCGGMNDVTIAEGYNSGTDFSVFKCHNQVSYCPGGEPGHTCAEGRTDVACARCEDGKTPAAEGRCEVCNKDMTRAVASVVVFVLIGLLICFYRVVDRKDVTRETHTFLTCALAVGLLVTLAQQLNVISSFQVEWPNLLQSLASVDLGNSLQVQCVADPSPTTKFLLGVGMLFFCMVVVIVVHVVYVLYHHHGRFMERNPTLIGTIGALLMVFYISVISMMIRPLQCLSNPNGKPTVASFQSVVCWTTGEHEFMVAVGMLTLSVPIAFLALCIHVTRRYPSDMRKHKAWILQAYAFLFFRYRPEVFWYGLAHMLRGLAMALVPTVTNAFGQIVIAQFITMSGLVGSIIFRPWRVEVANHLEHILTLSQLGVLNICSFFAMESNTTPLAWLVLVAVMLSVASFIGVFIHSIGTHVRMQKHKTFKYLICHNRSSAGCFARLLKMRLASLTQRVVIDCDCQVSFDTLFDYVGSRTENLILLCSQGILLQLHVVGQIIMAKSNSLRVVKVVFPDYEEPDEDLTHNYTNHVNMTKLTQRGLSTSHVSLALDWLHYGVVNTPKHVVKCRCRPPVPPEVTTVVLPLMLGKGVLDALCRVCTEDKPGESKSLQLEYKADETRDDLCTPIIVDHQNMEAVSTAYLLAFMLTQRLPSDMQPFVLPQGVPVPRAASESVALVMCTNDTFQQSNVLRSIMQCAAQERLCVPVIAEPGFRTPHVDKPSEYEAALKAVTQNADELFGAIVGIFEAVPIEYLPAHQDDRLLEAGAGTVLQRLTNRSMIRRSRSIISFRSARSAERCSERTSRTISPQAANAIYHSKGTDDTTPKCEEAQQSAHLVSFQEDGKQEEGEEPTEEKLHALPPQRREASRNKFQGTREGAGEHMPPPDTHEAKRQRVLL